MQRNIMAIDNFYGNAAGKNFVIYSFLSKQHLERRRRVSKGVVFGISFYRF